MLLSLAVILLLVGLSVLIHFEALHLLTNFIARLKTSPRFSILLVFFGCFLAHIIEVVIFAAGFYFLIHNQGLGRLVGDELRHSHLVGELTNSWSDCIYFSLTSYTSLGFGDIAPTGWLRFLSGIEALIGLLLIAWTASFMYLEMQKHWKVK